MNPNEFPALEGSMLGVVPRLTPTTFATTLDARPFALILVDRGPRVAFHEGIRGYFAAAHPGRFAFGLLLRSPLTTPAWLEATFVSAVGPMRTGVHDGYYLFHQGVVIGHHRGDVRDGVHYGDPAELAKQRERVHTLAFGGKHVAPATLEATRAIVMYFDGLVMQRDGGRASHERYVYEERESTTPSPPREVRADPYEVLGVDRSASDDEVKAAYREGLKMNHPDKVAHLSAALQKFAEAQTLAIVSAYGQIREERS